MPFGVETADEAVSTWASLGLLVVQEFGVAMRLLPLLHIGVLNRARISLK